MASIQSFFIGPLATGSYLVMNGNEAVMIDVGGDPTPVLKKLESDKLTLTHILLTHLHYDHTMGVADLSNALLSKQAVAPVVLLHEADEFLLDGAVGMPDVAPFAYSQVPLGAQRFAGLDCTVLHTPGHTPGGVSYYFPALASVFVGDALFQRSIGRTDFPGGDTDTLFNSIRTQLYTLPDETTVYPGHGPETGVGDEKRANPFVRP